MLALRQRNDLTYANISANKISLPRGQSYTERNIFQRLLKFKTQILDFRSR